MMEGYFNYSSSPRSFDLKICKLMWSANRVEFLEKTLQSHHRLDFGDHEVHGIFIDDMPLDRDDEYIRHLANSHGFDEVILHEENQGITKVFTESHKLIASGDYDYVWHQEDDFTFNFDVKIDDLIELYQTDDLMLHIGLSRQAWYDADFNTPNYFNLKGNNIDRCMYTIDESDTYYKNYLYEKAQAYFTTMAGFYPAWICKEPIEEMQNIHRAEGVILRHYIKYHNPDYYSARLKHPSGVPLTHHIGEWFHGQRVAPGEPGWEDFDYYETGKKYCSIHGHIVE